MDGRVILVWSAVVVLLAGIGLGMLAASHHPLLDADLCPAAPLQSGHSVVLVDQTDAYAPNQAETLRPILVDVRDRLPRYARLSVVALGSELQEPPLPLFSLCNPGRGAQVNGLIESDQSASLFDQPLDRLIASLETEKTEPRSPILQTIAAVSRLPNFTKGKRELDVVSDLMENSSLLTQYHDGPGDFARLRDSPAYAQAKADLTGVTVRLFYLRRASTAEVQTDAQRAFWLDYLRASGARDVSWCGVSNATATRKEVICVPASS